MSAQALIDAIDHYADTRHRCGAHVYNAETAAARRAVVEQIEALNKPKNPPTLQQMIEESLFVKAGLHLGGPERPKAVPRAMLARAAYASRSRQPGDDKS